MSSNYKFNEQYTYFSSSKLEELAAKDIKILAGDKYTIFGNLDKAREEGFILDDKGYIMEYSPKLIPTEKCYSCKETPCKTPEKCNRDSRTLLRLPVFDFISPKATEIVEGARNTDYGSPVESFKKIADMASLLCNKELTPLECLRVMKAVKLVRESYKHKEDNLVDLIGYTEIENMIINAEK